MKIIAVSLLVVMLAGSAMADPPASQPFHSWFSGSSPGFYTGQLKATGDGTVEFYAWRFPWAGLKKVSIDEKTVVVLADGRPGKLSDLKVEQWGKVFWESDRNSSTKTRMVKIELKETPSWAQRLADLEKNAGSLEVGIRVFINGKGDEEELHLLGPDNKGGYKEPFFARLTKDEMTQLLHYLAAVGFLGNAIDRRTESGQPPVLAYLAVAAGDFCEFSQLGSDTVKRLEGIKAVLPDKAAAKMEPLLAKVRKAVGVPASQPAASQPALRLDKLVGQKVTLTGTFGGPGKMADYITLNASEWVYFKGKMSGLQPTYDQRIRATGVLQHDPGSPPSLPHRPKVPTTQTDPPHYFFDAAEIAAAPTTQPADPESAWRAVLAALKAGDTKALAAVTTEEGYESIMHDWKGPLRQITPEQMKSLGEGWAKWPVRFTKKTADAAAAELGPVKPAVPSLLFIRTEEGWKLDQWTPGE